MPKESVKFSPYVEKYPSGHPKKNSSHPSSSSRRHYVSKPGSSSARIKQESSSAPPTQVPGLTKDQLWYLDGEGNYFRTNKNVPPQGLEWSVNEQKWVPIGTTADTNVPPYTQTNSNSFLEGSRYPQSPAEQRNSIKYKNPRNYNWYTDAYAEYTQPPAEQQYEVTSVPPGAKFLDTNTGIYYNDDWTPINNHEEDNQPQDSDNTHSPEEKAKRQHDNEIFNLMFKNKITRIEAEAMLKTTTK